MRVVMTAAHAGWGSETVPVGGGGAVCERLCAAWAEAGLESLIVLGTGPHPPPVAGSVPLTYRRLIETDLPPTRLTELQYARLCRRFERACTEFVLQREPRAVVVAHDISEGPDFVRLRDAGVPVVLLVHVDVVEYFVRMYLRGWISAPRAVRLFARLRRWPVPDVLRLVFDKQWDAVAACARLIVPSRGMESVLASGYPRLAPRWTTVPWGAPEVEFDASAVAREREVLRGAWGLRDDERVLLTLSRISPEKGQDRLLQAVRYAEATQAAGPGFRVVICGAPAFMQGEAFMRRLRALASQLRTPVIFAGHLDGIRKRAALSLASIFVAASRHESYGLTTMEAYAAGVPVVAVESHGALATVDESCGRLVPDGDRLVPRLWLQIETLLRDEPLRAMLAEGARRRAATERFSTAAARLLEIVHAVSRHSTDTNL